MTTIEKIKNLLLSKEESKEVKMYAEMILDDGKIIKEIKTLDVAVGNGICAGNKKILCPDAILDDGLLDITIVGNVGFKSFGKPL